MSQAYERATKITYMWHVSQKLNFPLWHFMLLTIVTALPEFLFSACLCAHCICTSCFELHVYVLFVILFNKQDRAHVVLQNCFFSLFHFSM